MMPKPPLVPALTAWRFPSLWGKRISNREKFGGRAEGKGGNPEG